MAQGAALGGDDAQNHPRRDAEQVAGHQLVGGQDHRVIQGQPHPGPVTEDVDDPLGGVQNIHIPQLQIAVVGHGQQFVGVALAHPVDGLGGAGAGLYVGVNFI